MKQKTSKKKTKKVASGRGCLHLHSSFNNLIITISQENGDKLAQISSRTATGYRGAKKSTPFAAQKATEEALIKLSELGISSVKVTAWGIGSGRDAAIKKICSSPNLEIEELVDKTALAFNGCRSRKAPRK